VDEWRRRLQNKDMEAIEEVSIKPHFLCS